MHLCSHRDVFFCYTLSTLLLLTIPLFTVLRPKCFPATFKVIFYDLCSSTSFHLILPQASSLLSRSNHGVALIMTHRAGLTCVVCRPLSAQEGVSNRNLPQVCDHVFIPPPLLPPHFPLWLLFNSALSCCRGTSWRRASPAM